MRSSSHVSGGERTPSSNSATTVDYSDIEHQQQLLRSAVDLRVGTLEKALLAREQQVLSLQNQMRQLQEDYQYNFNLIAERDRAVEEAAAYVTRFQGQLKQTTDDLDRSKQQINILESQKKELQEHLRNHQLQAEVKLADIRRQIEAVHVRHQQQIAEQEAAWQAERDAMQQKLLSHVTKDDEIRATTIEALDATMREQEATFKRREQAFVLQIDEWKAKHDAIRTESTNLRNQLTQCSMKLAERDGEIELLQRQSSNERDGKQKQIESLEKSATATEEAHKSAVIEYEQRLMALTAEKQSLQVLLSTTTTNLEILQQRFDTIDSVKTQEAAKFQETCDAIRKSFSQTSARYDEEIRSLEGRLHKASQESAKSQQDLAEASALSDRRQIALMSMQERFEQVDRQLQQSTRELDAAKRALYDLREENRAAESRLREEIINHNEGHRADSRRIEDLSSELEACRQDLSRKLQLHQTENTRLSRELSCSEAARAALESQLELLRDDRGLQYQYDRLLHEKHDLEEQVVKLTQANEAIRRQVTEVTSEIQNFPDVKNARQNEATIRELRDTIIVLEAAARDHEMRIREKDLEIGKYQQEILKSRNNGEALQELSADRSRLRRELEEANRARDLALETHCGDEAADRTVETLKEAEFWRQRGKQLEIALAEALRERDAARAEVQQHSRSLQAALAEKRSITEVNNILKSQLKQSYHDAANVANARAISAPVLSAVTLNTAPHFLAVEKVAAEQERRIEALQCEVAALRTQQPHQHRRAVDAVSSSLHKTTASFEARVEGKRAFPASSYGRSESGGSFHKSGSSSGAESRQGENTEARKLVRKGDVTVRNYARDLPSH